MASGINLDLRNPVGKPPASVLVGFRSARFVYNVSNRAGSTDLNAAAALYVPYIDSLLHAGILPIIVLTHETWGEGQGFDWKAMSNGDWQRFGDGLAEMAGRIAWQFPSDRLVYQIGNQQDAPALSDSVSIPPVPYGRLFNQVAQAIKRISPSSKAITGGYVSGPGGGMAHFKASGINPDGVAFHPYLASAGGLYVYDGVPSINQQIIEWRKLRRPLYLTEFGVLDKPNEPAPMVAEYARAFLAATPDVLGGPVWYAWRDGMHNGYGVAEANGVIRQPLFTALTAGGDTSPDPPVTPEPVPRPYMALSGLKAGATLNLRDQPTTASSIIGKLKNGHLLRPLGQVLDDGTNKWADVELQGGTRGWLATDAAGKATVEL